MTLRKTSKKYRLNLRNIIKGSIYAVTTAVSTEAVVAVASWNGFGDINYQRFLLISGVALFSYLSTKLFQDEKGNYTSKKE